MARTKTNTTSRQRNAAAANLRWLWTVQINTKNADAARPAGQHWDLSTNTYVPDPVCGAGKHFDLNTYQCVPD
jgi:hypothetical protein